MSSIPETIYYFGIYWTNWINIFLSVKNLFGFIDKLCGEIISFAGARHKFEAKNLLCGSKMLE
jgi:hypothetical protein